MKNTPKNSPKKLWFRAKRYGWGWQPVTWQGWAILLGYLVIMISTASRIDARSHSGSDTLIGFAIPFIALTAALIWICYRTGEKPSWRWGDKTAAVGGAVCNTATKTVREMAPVILEKIKSAKHILLHLHPSPDPDSLCSGLAMKMALEQLGKKVTLIAGDSPTPSAFSHFPGFDTITKKNFGEVDFSAAGAPDLFIAQDAGGLETISRLAPPVFPASLSVIVIDHHISNPKYGQINLVDATYAATCQLLADLLRLWNINITHDIAINLIVGMYTDTSGFKHESATPALLATVAELSVIAPDYTKAIFVMENSNTPGAIRFQGLALSSIQTFLDGRLAISIIPYSVIEKKIAEGLFSVDDTGTNILASLLKSAIGWDVGVCLIEREPGKVKASFRTRDSKQFDLSVIATRCGGGGHKAAAGANMNCSIEEATKRVIASVEQAL